MFNLDTHRTYITATEKRTGIQICFTVLHSSEHRITNCDELFYYIKKSKLVGPESGVFQSWYLEWNEDDLSQITVNVGGRLCSFYNDKDLTEWTFDSHVFF